VDRQGAVGDTVTVKSAKFRVIILVVVDTVKVIPR